jgi:curved DNA-binding protein CbpA
MATFQKKPLKRKRSSSVKDPPPSLNPYHILQVRRDATPSEIREAYRRLALWHHPGRRRDLSTDEAKRRQQIFRILAACYETLLDNETRQIYDVLLNSQYKGEVFVGRKNIWSPVASKTKRRDNVDNYGLLSSCRGIADEVDVPALISNSSSDDSLGSLDFEPVSSLWKSHRNQPFSDPYDIFDNVFGSSLYERVQLDDGVPSLNRPPLASAWKGSSKSLKDGAVVSTTSRVLHDRKLTRTEIITGGGLGRKHTTVTVTSEVLEGSDTDLTGVSTSCFVCGVTEDDSDWNAWWKKALDSWTYCFLSCGSLFPE